MGLASEHQLAVLRMYGRLVELREDWGGALVLSCGPGAAESGVSAAVSIAGGVSLAVDQDAAAVKAAMRGGEIDFVVNTLDEALRTLKNQVRQQRPLSVGLIADVDTAVAEMVERGVSPELVVGRAMPGVGEAAGRVVPAPPSLPRRLKLNSNGGIDESVPVARQGSGGWYIALEELGAERSGAGVGDSKEVWIGASGSGLRALDERLVAMFTVDLVRRRWVERVAQYLRGARDGRWVWLDEAERAEVEGWLADSKAVGAAV